MNLLQGKTIYLRHTIVAWVCLCLLAAALSVSPLGQWMERTVVLEWMYELRGVRLPPSDVVIVSMDKGGADLPAVGSGGRLWSRHLYSSLINRLSDAQAAGTILDVTFEDARDEEQDSALETSLARSNQVVLFQRLTRVNDIDIAVPPLSRFASTARAQAVFPLPKFSRVDGYWPFFPVRDLANGITSDEELPSLPVAALQLRLLNEIGLAPFEHSPDVNLPRDTNATDAEMPFPGDVSSLISNLRKKFMANAISDVAKGNLVRVQIEYGSLTATMLRSLMQVYGKRGLLPLNFYGPPRTIETIDHITLLSEEYENTQSLHRKVSEKMVFIGHSSKAAVDQHDGFRTVYTQNGLDLSGVEIAATAYANLIDGSMLRPLSIPLTIVIHVLLGLVAAFIALRTSILKAVILIVVLASGYFAFAMFLFVDAYSVLPISVPLFFLLPFILFTALLLRYFGTSRQAGVYRHGIQTMLPSRVIADIESGHLEQAAHQHLHGTCMMTDIANFTHFTEVQGHERMGNLSREYFSLVMEEIKSSGGELYDVEGDGLTAFWDHPVVNVESRQSAASAALQITSHVELFNQRNPSTPFDTRIGLDNGRVKATYIGGDSNRRYCLVGDVANTCSRLEGLNKRLGTSVLASKAAVSEDKSLLLRPVGKFLLKGKSKTLDVFEIMNLQTSATVNERTLCKRFAEAMQRVAEGQFEAAESILVDILLNNETDGPARFYLELLNGQNSAEVQLDEHSVVHVYRK